MKKTTFIILILLSLPSCSTKHDISTDDLKEKTVQSIKNKNFDKILTGSLGTDSNSKILDEFGEYSSALENMETALNKGYRPLLEDINNKKYSCIKEKEILGKYKFSDWETRNIGFYNWPTRVKGGMLLEKIKLLNSKILVARLLNSKELDPFIEKYEAELNNTEMELFKLTKENSWAD